jgi:hypothetical protein
MFEHVSQVDKDVKLGLLSVATAMLDLRPFKGHSKDICDVIAALNQAQDAHLQRVNRLFRLFRLAASALGLLPLVVAPVLTASPMF